MLSPADKLPPPLGIENRFQKVEALRGQSTGSGGYRPRTAQQKHVQSSFGRVTFMQVVWIRGRGGDARAMRVQSSLGREVLPQEIETIRTLTPKKIIRLCRDITPAEARIF